MPESDWQDVQDWRRRVHELYAEIRELSDPRAAHEHWRDERDLLLKSHPASPVPAAERASFNGVPVAPYDDAFRFVVPVLPSEPLRIEVPTGTDGIVAFERIGAVTLDGLGTLDAWWLTSYGGGLFIPVKDSLAGSTTYGGGRYLIDTAKGADLGGNLPSVVVDFNFSYNPSCAYDPAWTCPLAPEGNAVPVVLPVGELVSTG